jgi:hypothetical protein
MEISLIDHSPDDIRQSLSIATIQAMCSRAFGNGPALTAIEELDGGTINTTYKLQFDRLAKKILRVAPLSTANLTWDDAFLMRCEYHIMPHFASLANMIPRIEFADFSHNC